MKFDTQGFLGSFPEIMTALPLTLALTVVTMAAGLALGTLLAVLLRRPLPVLTPLIHLYISFFRGTPLLVQLFVLYYGLPQVFPAFTHLDALVAAFIGMTLNSAAYLAESVRGALSAVEPGQMDACLSVGMHRGQALWHVILPQAARVALPSVANAFVGLLKETSLVFALGVTDVLAQAKQYAAATYLYMESFLAVALVYWGATVAFGYLQKRLEQHLAIPYDPSHVAGETGRGRRRVRSVFKEQGA